MRPDDRTPERGPNPWTAFLELLSRPAPPTSGLEGLLASLQQAGHLEQALACVKRTLPLESRSGRPWHSLRAALEATVQKARTARMHQWQHDPHRRTLRLRFEVRQPAAVLHPPALLHALTQALMDAGLPVAMDLGRSPRPAAHLGHPLPPGLEGLGEWADVVLRQEAGSALEDLPERAAPHLPEGLRILGARYVPNHGSQVLELGQEARWQWRCPSQLQAQAMERLASFLAASSWELEKSGKVEGRKTLKRLEVRPLVKHLHWQADVLHLTLRLAAGEALNPVKLLAGLLEVDPGEIQGMTRTEVVLGEDPRLKASDKFAPKLSNIYEDAVLLESGGSITLVEEDDDEPMVLG